VRRSLLWVSLVALTAAGCRDGGSDERPRDDRSRPQPGAVVPDARREPGAFPRVVRDGSGAAIRLEARPRRIVSQTLATDEILFALGLQARLVGASSLARDEAYSNVVAEASSSGVPSVSDAEQILRLTPDLVFVASYSRAEVVRLLGASGAPVYRFTNFERLEDIEANIRRVGEVTGDEAAAERLVAAMRDRLRRIAARHPSAAAARPRVLSYSASGFTAGKNTLFDEIVRHAGGLNVAAEHGLTGFPRIGAEQALAWDPDYLVAGFSRDQKTMVRARLLANPAVASTRAARSDRIVLLDNRALLSTSHHIVHAIEELARVLDDRPDQRPDQRKDP
jgi:iron complex transport system substrate-binding protein